LSDVAIRPLAGPAEYRACVALQRRTWGESFDEVVPPSMLMVAQEMGGVASGAFDGERLAGFVFGISGVRDGRPAHWSDMLAVDPEYRGRGLGRRLKLHQRERLLGLGVERMHWTFDPLEARNAHLNLTRLGATASSYRRDAYGDSPSPLHAGIGTDRLVADWDLASARVRDRIAGTAEPARAGDDAQAVLAAEPGGAFPRPGAFRPQPGADAVLVAVPADIQALKGQDAALARAWRLAVREALEWGFEQGLVAVELERTGSGACAYTLTRIL
jgi:predicted GNAT superfamily acetyltransferase